MASKDEKNVYEIQNAATGIPPSDEEFDLEEILTEYGGGLEKALLRDADLPEEEPPQ